MPNPNPVSTAVTLIQNVALQPQPALRMRPEPQPALRRPTAASANPARARR